MEQQHRSKHNIKESYVQLERIDHQSCRTTAATIKREYDENEESPESQEVQRERRQDTGSIPVKLETFDDMIVYESIDNLLSLNTASIENNEESHKNNKVDFDFVSDVDIVKNEIGVDEVTLNTFREEMRKISHKNAEQLRSLQNHMTNEHVDEKKHQCQICNQPCSTEYDLKVHSYSHIKKNRSYIRGKREKYKTFECYLCKQIFPKLKFLRFEHMKTHLPEKSYDCKYCHSSYSRVRDHQEHVMKNHFHLFKFQCNICHEILKKTKNMFEHQKSCVNPNKRSVMHFKCSLCDSEFPRLTELRRHIVMTECTNEDIKVKRKKKLNIENILKRGDLKPVEKLVNDKKIFKCPICEHTSEQMSLLGRHIRTHTKPFQCLYCNMKFASNFHICKHIRARHPTEYVHRCFQCQRWFYKIKTFKKHGTQCSK